MANLNLPEYFYQSHQVRELEALVCEHSGVASIQLMKRAGTAAFHLARELWPNCDNLVVLCGGGNNGGDGYVVAALAAQKGVNVRVLAAVDPAQLTGDAERAYRYALQESVVVEFVNDWSKPSIDDANTVLVDALLGIGLMGDVRAPSAAAIAFVNRSGLPVLALDVPSGLCADSGAVLGSAVVATATLSFVAIKPGLVSGAVNHVGELYLEDLGLQRLRQVNEGFEQALSVVKPALKRVTTNGELEALQPRDASAHKGDFGHVMVIGGGAGFGGAVILAAEAAARSGSGLVSVATDPLHVVAVLARRPELMAVGVPSGQELELLLERPSVLVVGPGLGRSPWAEQMLQQAAATQKPMVLDADALNILAAGRVLAKSGKRANWVLTPHPGEAARLLNSTVDAVQRDRYSAARNLQAIYGGVVVLKGAGTVIASDQGLMVACVGNPGMASGGMGDVLAGVIGALMAQGLSPLNASTLAVCVHGDAADLAVLDGGERGMLASDLIPYMRELLNP